MNYSLNEPRVRVFITDIDERRTLVSNGADDRVKSASTIKVLIASELLRRLKEGDFSWTDMISAVDAKMDNRGIETSLIMALDQEEFTLRDLTSFMMIHSDNLATNMMIDMLGMEGINSLAMELGMRDTALERKMCDMKMREAGYENYTSLADMERLFTAIAEGEIGSREDCEALLTIMSSEFQLDLMKRHIAEDLRVAHKYGELEDLDHDVGIVYRGEKRYFVGIFCTGTKSAAEGREKVASTAKTMFDLFIFTDGSRGGNG